MIPGYLKTLREMNRGGAKGSDPLNALNALNAQPRAKGPDPLNALNALNAQPRAKGSDPLNALNALNAQPRAKGPDPLNALNALNAHPRLERLAAEEDVIVECEKTDSVGRSAASSQTSTCAKSAISAKSPSPYQSEFDALERRCPDFIDAERWRQAVEDGRQFLASWGDQAQALGWTARELFSLHTPPERPAASYGRLSRYDETGLIWLLRGRPVIALTETTAAIQGATAVFTYRKLNKPALGPLGDSLDDIGAAT
jgi:hypothetical protein